MAHPRYRANLQEGLCLNINRLIRQRFLCPGSFTGPRRLVWSYTYSGERIASACLSSDLSESYDAWVKIEIGDRTQIVHLNRQARNFGGGQWYFVCPRSNVDCSTLWLPPGASTFASRQFWGRRVAYSSQFQARHDRALSQAQAIRYRLGGVDFAGIDEFDPPKPKGMRWRTFNRLIAKSRHLEEIADERTISLINQLIHRS